MEQRALGRGLVSVIGFGAGHVGGPAEERAVVALLDRALELGATLVDTAPSYGASEERIARWLAPRRARVLLSTKAGYGVPGHEDWTPGCIRAGVDHALAHLGTSYLDILHLHSCPLDVLRRPGLLEALGDAVRAGKVRMAGYSGEGEALDWAIESGAFGVVQTSVNLFDQGGIDGAVRAAGARGLGVLAKRPLGNAPWRFAARPAASDIATYWDRMQALALPPNGLAELAIRFALTVPDVSCLLVGTSRIEHLESAVRAAAAGPLPAPRYAELRAAFAQVGQGWGGII
jgi:aryl-alcohol dehydrogenase-like predicted oxidoreductase